MEAYERDKNISIVGKECGSAVTKTAASNASVGICFDQVLHAKYGRGNECKSWSGMYILLPVQERYINIDLYWESARVTRLRYSTQ